MPTLSYIEKKIVCDIAREAFDLWPGRAEFALRCAAGVNVFDAWRHAEQARAVGCRSLNHCAAELFPRLKAHFQELRSAHRAAHARAMHEAAAGQQQLFCP